MATTTKWSELEQKLNEDVIEAVIKTFNFQTCLPI